jgi:hypothetical protein
MTGDDKIFVTTLRSSSHQPVVSILGTYLSRSESMTKLKWYRDVLGFAPIEIPLSGGKRWLLMAPPGSTETRLLLAKATMERQLASVGHQAGV